MMKKKKRFMKNKRKKESKKKGKEKGEKKRRVGERGGERTKASCPPPFRSALLLRLWDVTAALRDTNPRPPSLWNIAVG